MAKRYAWTIRLLIVTLLLQLLSGLGGLFSIPEAQAATYSGYCTANYLNVRTGPSTSYSIVTSGGEKVHLTKNDKVTITGTSGQWYKITCEFKGKSVSGYCINTYIKKTGTVSTPTPTKKPTATPTPASSGGSYSISATINANVLNIRSGAGTSYSKVGQLTRNAKVTVIGTKYDASKDLWYQVTTVISGKTVKGYMLSDYVKLSSPIPTATTTPRPTATPTNRVTNAPTKKPTTTPTPQVQRSGIIIANELNIRSGAGTTYTKYATLTKNMTLTVLSEKKDSHGDLWYQVRAKYGNSMLTGYMLAKYIKITGTVVVNTPTPKPTSTPTPKPTNTPTPKPTSTPTPKPTSTPTPKPTNTPTPKPTSTPTPKPTSTPTPKPTNTPTQEPSLSVTPTPEGTPGKPVAARVNASSLNVRSGAGTEYAKIVNLTRNHAVTIIGIAYDTDGALWYEITTTLGTVDYRGYMLGIYIAPEEEFVPGEAPVPMPDENDEEEVLYRYEGYLTGSSVNMRTGPSTSYAILTKLYEQQKVTVIGQKWNTDGIVWYRIITEVGGKTLVGYVSSTYIKVAGGATGIWATVGSEQMLGKSPSEQSNSVLTENGNEVILQEEQYVYITGEQMVNSVKWMKVIAKMGEETVFGYIKATHLTFVSEETEAPFEPMLSDADFEEAMRAEGFPESYLPYLLELHKQHPQWRFTAFQTGLSWDHVISEEDKVGYNLITNSKPIRWLSFAQGAYNWGTDAFVPYDGSTWVTVSNAGLQYYMDPRNWLEESYIFMFEELSFDRNNHTQEGVESILKGTPMYKTSFTYTDDFGTNRTILYSQAFMEAAEYSGVSPYHLASRVKQEVVTGSSSFSSSATGKVEGFEGYYNFYNIGAYNSTASMGAIKNGLKFAKYGGTNATLNQGSLIPWNNRYDAIVGGAFYIGYSYINRGQNSVYLQKFNMSGKSTFEHQYMANVEAPKSEAYKVYLAYQSMEDYEYMNITFTIPVFENMPETAVSEPPLVYNPNAYLKSLSLTTDTGKAVTLDSAFSYNKMQYTATIPAGATKVNVTAKTVSSLAKVLSGTEGIVLSENENVLYITVQAQNETTITYTITLKWDSPVQQS